MNLERLAFALNVPMPRLYAHAQELIEKGLLFSANGSLDFEYLWFSMGSPHWRYLEDNELSAGPFPVETKHYLVLTQRLKDYRLDDKEYLAILLALLKWEYDKTGMSGRVESFEMTDELHTALTNVVLAGYDLDNPHLGEFFTWFNLNVTMLQMAQEVNPNNPWQVKIPLEQDLSGMTIPRLREDEFFLMLVPEGWERFLPEKAHFALMHLSYALNGPNSVVYNRYKLVKALDDIDFTEPFEDPERELLVKEILDFNGLKYPVTSSEVIDFFIDIGFIQVQTREEREEKRQRRRPRLGYKLAGNIPSLASLEIPEGWEERASRWVSTGTLLPEALYSLYLKLKKS